MADPLSATSAFVGLVAFSYQASKALHDTIKSYHQNPKCVRDLRDELSALENVLLLLKQSLSTSGEAGYAPLKSPVRRCGRACEQFAQALEKCSRPIQADGSSFRGWLKIRWMGSDIHGFKDTLVGYKSTIVIAMAGVNLRTSKASLEVIQEYKEMIQSTTTDLKDHLYDIDNKLRESAQEQYLPADPVDITETFAERESTMRSLEICGEASSFIEERQKNMFEKIADNNGPDDQADHGAAPSPARQMMNDTLQGCKFDIKSANAQLSNHLLYLSTKLSNTSSGILQTSSNRLEEREKMSNQPSSIGTSALDQNFQRRKQPSRFFTVGKVFSCVWAEPSPEAQDGTVNGRFDERIAQKARFFVVVREGPHYCICLGIFTYGGRGVAKTLGVVASEHSIIYTGRKPPKPSPAEEQSFLKTGLMGPPIKVMPDVHSPQLSDMSRLNFGKFYTIQHNTMVKPFGTIARDAMGDFLRQIQPVRRPETPPTPLSTVPFRRDPDHVHRGLLIDEIHGKLSVPAARVALVGLGGVGKSQLAIEYAYQVREASPSTWVLWIHASSAARFELSVLDALDQLKVPGREDPKANALKLFRGSLRDPRKGRWLLILDNADDTRFLLEPPSAAEQTGRGSQRGQSGERYYDYLPTSDHGSILVTTRSWEAALKIVSTNDIIAVEPMDEEQALALVRKKQGHQRNREDVLELARALDFMPLAISQAAAYISQRAPRCSIQHYVEKLQRSDESRLGLLEDRNERDLRRDREASNSIIQTWQMSFEHIHMVRPSAAGLLSLMSFFDGQAIPEALLRQSGADQTKNKLSRVEREWEDGSERSHSEGKSDGNSGSFNNAFDNASDTPAEEFEDDILLLRNYSFISVNPDMATFKMHRLVQLATRRWLELRGQLEYWQLKFISNLDDAFPVGKFENWARCQPLFPHAIGALEMKLADREGVLRQASLLRNSGCYALEKGAYADAERMEMQSVRVRMNVLGGGHPDTLTSMDDLAITYRNQGRWKEAEELEAMVMETRRKVLGSEHPDTLTSISNLALTYQSQGRWKEAEELGAMVIETRRKVLGSEHPDTLTSMSNLALTYQSQGRWKEAEELGAMVIETRRKVLGSEHPDTLTSMSNLALTYQSQGRWKEAEELGAMVIETRRKVLGEEHPSTLASINDLASTYWNQGRWKDAEGLSIQVIERRKRVLGEDHPDTRTAINNLAITQQSQGRDEETVSLHVNLE